jgi:hypothetical protein
MPEIVDRGGQQQFNADDTLQPPTVVREESSARRTRNPLVRAVCEIKRSFQGHSRTISASSRRKDSSSFPSLPHSSFKSRAACSTQFLSDRISSEPEFDHAAQQL